MAGDWIKLQKDTPDKPEVLAMSARLNIDPDAVVGKLVRIWSWFDTHTIKGDAESVTFSFLDRLTGVTGFAEQMMLVGWLVQNGSTLLLPNFDYHNGETAKNRALGNKRQQKYRNSDDKNNDSVTVNASPEKRREEKKREYKKNTNTNKTPEGVTQETWESFLAQRKLSRAAVTETVIKSIQKEADKIEWTLEQALTEIVARGWRGFKADWVIEKQKEQPKSFFQQDLEAKKAFFDELSGITKNGKETIDMDILGIEK
jgi:hypothetical protein